MVRMLPGICNDLWLCPMVLDYSNCNHYHVHPFLLHVYMICMYIMVFTLKFLISSFDV